MAVWQCIWCGAQIVGSDESVTAAGWARTRQTRERLPNEGLCPTCQRERHVDLRAAIATGRAENLNGALYLQDTPMITSGMSSFPTR